MSNETGRPRSGLVPPDQAAGMTTLLTEQDTAALLKVSVKGLQGLRYRGGGPPFVKLGRLVRYRITDLEAFITAALRTSTSDAGSTSRNSSRIRVETLLEKTGRSLATVDPMDPPVSNKSR